VTPLFCDLQAVFEIQSDMNIGIIGSGNVGSALGSRFAKAGHNVVFGSRNPSSDAMKTLTSQSGPTSRAASQPDAAAASDVVVLATPWKSTREIVESLGSLEGKVLLDCTNPLVEDLSGLALGTTTSAAEQIAQWSPGAKVVKIFNTVGSNVMANSSFAGRRPVMFYAGDDGAAKKVAAGLADELGFDPIDAGPLSQARVLEPFALLWISLAFMQGHGREIAFQFMKR
jgi:NADPH-dependent F420 reductase